MCTHLLGREFGHVGLELRLRRFLRLSSRLSLELCLVRGLLRGCLGGGRRLLLLLLLLAQLLLRLEACLRFCLDSRLLIGGGLRELQTRKRE